MEPCREQVCRCGPESTKARCLHNIAKHFGRPGELHWLAWLVVCAQINQQTGVVPGSSWSWKFSHQSQNRSILPNSREKELLNGHSTPERFFFTPERFRTVFNVFLTLFERFFPLHNVRSVPNGKKTLQFSFVHTNPQNRYFLSLELKIPVLERSR